MPIAGGVLYAAVSILGDPYMNDATRTWARIFEGSLILFLVGVMALIAGNPLFELYLFHFGLDNLYGTWPVVVPWVVVGAAVLLAVGQRIERAPKVR